MRDVAMAAGRDVQWRLTSANGLCNMLAPSEATDGAACA